MSLAHVAILWNLNLALATVSGISAVSKGRDEGNRLGFSPLLPPPSGSAGIPCVSRGTSKGLGLDEKPVRRGPCPWRQAAAGQERNSRRGSGRGQGHPKTP